jgi:excisionase family DNA binding protein
MICGRAEEAQQLRCMNQKSDTKRLSETVTNLATTIIEIIDLKLREQAEAAKIGQPGSSGIDRLIPAEGWASMEETMKHLKISRRTLYSWMMNRTIPYVKIGRGVRFKLSQVDEAMNRRVRGGLAY